MALISRHLNPDRSLSLDTFRGLTLAGMILVTNPGGPLSYAPLEHAAWNGWTPTDLVFPSFAFIIGVALTFALSGSHTKRGWEGRTLFDWFTPIFGTIQFAIKLGVQTGGFRHAPDPALGGYDVFFVLLLLVLALLPEIERRRNGGSAELRVIHHGIMIFALGFIWTFDALNPAGFRTMGVLQRLGMVYLASGLIVLHSRRRGQLAIVAGLLAAYWIVMKVAPVPGFVAGDLTREGNFAGYVDRLILGARHMYEPSPLPYWDPEGLLGTIPAIATALLGAIAGGWMRETRDAGRRMRGLLVVGAILLVFGLVLAPWFPINKNLWSPTFVLVTGGVDFLLLAVCIWCVDVIGVKRPIMPLVAIGANSILAYVLSGTLMHYFANIPAGSFQGKSIGLRDAIYQYLFASWLDPYNASLGLALVYVAAWIWISMVLYRKRIFVKI